MTVSFSTGRQRPSWLYLAATGQVNGVSRVATLGYNDDIDTASVPEDIWSGASLGVLNGIDHKNIQLPAAGGVSMEILSTSANDAAAGTGARTALISYLDENYNQATQTVTLNGTTPVSLAGPILRINAALLVTCGSTETNVGAISIRAAGGLGATYSHMLAGAGIAQSSLFTVPANHVFDVLDILLSAHQVDTTQRAVTAGFMIRSSAGRRFRGLLIGCTSNTPYVHRTGAGIPISPLAAGTDTWLRCEACSQNNTAISGALFGILR